jgi:PAS domain S-box-containing protein
MKRVLVNISNSALNKKIIGYSAKFKSLNFFFLSCIEDFVSEVKIIQPDVLIVGDAEYKTLATNTSCHSMVSSIGKFILAGHNSKETKITPDLSPVLLRQDFDIADFEQLISPLLENSKNPEVIKLEEELLDEKRNMQVFIDSFPDVIYFKDANSKFTRVNKAHAKLLGCQSTAELNGKSDFDFFSIEHAQQAFDDEQEIIKTGKAIKKEEKETWADRPDTWASSNKMPLRDRNGRVIGTFGISSDITKRKMMESQLQESQNLQDALIENIAVGILIVDPETRVIEHINSFASDLIGQSSTDIIGNICHQYICPAAQHNCPVLDNGQNVDNSERILLRGDKTPLSILKTVKRVTIGGKDKLLESFVDITLQKETELKLNTERELLQSLLDNTPDTIYFKDNLSRFTKINLAQAKCLGIESPEEAIGKTDFDFAPTEQAALSFKDEVEIMETGKALVNRVEKVRLKDGTVTWVSTTKIPIKNQLGEITGLVGVSRDVTESHNLELKLQQETNLLNSLLDSVPDVIYFKNKKSQFIRASKSCLKKHNMTDADNLIGKTDADFLNPEFASQTFQEEQLMMETGIPIIDKLQSKLDTATGKNRYDIANKIPIFDQNNRIVGLFGISRDITDLKNAELKLNKERELLQSLLDNTPDTIYFKDLSSKFTKINLAQANLLGLQSPEEAIGKDDFDFAPPEQASLSYRDELNIMKIGKPLLNHIERVRRTDGVVSWVSTTKVPIKDHTGKISGLVGVSRDITESHNLELKLKQETKLLNTLLDNIPDTIYFKDASSKFTRINQAQANSLGIASPEDAIGKSDFDFFDEAHATIAYNDEQKMMKIGLPIINKLEHFKTYDQYRYVTATKIPLKGEKGEIIGMVGISHEITDLKNTEAELNKEKELLQSLMDNIPDTIYFKDTLSRFTRINMAQARSLGIQSPDDAIGKTDFDFSPKEQASLSFQDELDIMASGKPLVNHVEKVNRADGNIIWVSTTKIPVKDQFGKVTGTVGMSRDITVLEEAKNSLVFAKEKSDEANRAKSLFLANMSHEIRTPMNGVIGMSDVLGQTILTDEQREYLGIITKSGNSLLSIINNILDFSKIESGSLELEKASINIRQVIENVADVLITSASNKGVDLMNYVDSSIPELVEGDSVRLSQILINLVNNALKFTDHGEVYFTAELSESSNNMFKVLFKVKDNGIGISKEAQEKIFQSFTQVDSSTTRKYGGTGLGLAISKRLVEMMGGAIGVESVEGEGSLFWFTAKFGVSVEKEKHLETTKLVMDGLKVLIVDDNRTNRFVFGKYLETWNCKYDQAENGEIALKMLIENAERNNPYDLALIDYQMEKMDGLKLAEQIQKNSKIFSTRLILLSSVTDVIPRSEVARRGFNYFLNKPVKLKDLYDVITSVTGNSAGDKIKKAITADEFRPNLSVLVAEDNPTNLKVAQLILKPFVTSFDSAENGLIAFEKFKTHKYDVIFMDIQMPVMNGYEAVKCIRDYEEENSLVPVKIVAMTANAMKEDVEQCLSSGMNEYLSKPFRRDDVFKIIERLNLHKDSIAVD